MNLFPYNRIKDALRGGGRMTKGSEQNHEDSWENLKNIREKVVQCISQNIDLYGITSSIGRLYGTMYFHDKPMTLDEMRDSLGMSKTSMSTGVRSLLDIKMVHRTWQKGVRKDLYTVEEDWYKTFIDLFSTKWGRAIEINQGEIQKAKIELEGLLSQTEHKDLKETMNRDLAKLQHAIEYYDWLNLLVKSFESGEIFKYIPKPDSK
jgi:DNA-binding transcriptional regulator GbsR (MarR family)